MQSGCSINVNACGNPANTGSGAGKVFSFAPYYPGGGAGNGGYGGNGATNQATGGVAAFNTLQNAPTTVGSGGGGNSPFSFGGAGGGVIQLNVSGTLQLNGTLSANAGNGTGTGGGGGAGGSLDLSVGNLTGSGVMSANGGSGVPNIGGGGGGGMIGVTLTSFTLTNSFTGAMTAYGGGGANFGGAGTIFIRTNSNNQSLTIVDNGGNIGTNTGITFSSSQSGLILRNGAIGCLNVNGQNFSTLLITANAWLVQYCKINSGTVSLVCDGNVTIQTNGGIIADSYGNPQNSGNGHGNANQSSPYFPGSGGGHGGYGGWGLSNLISGGVANDSTTAPTLGGSGGGGNNQNSVGGSGGGIVNLIVQTPFVTTVNGVISANGGNGSGSGGGGGSGGSIAITTRTLTGTGSINANGGSGVSGIGGGGGGGRIGISINQIVFFKTNIFGGTITAYGGSGAMYGGAGTIYYQTNLGAAFPNVLLDNNGHVGTNTSFNFNDYDVTVQNGAIGLLPSSGSWFAHNILILSNSAMTTLPNTANTTVQPTSLTIAQGGALTLDGGGYGSQSGIGPGGANGGLFGGGGHGGYGGGNPSGNGGAYDSVVNPIDSRQRRGNLSICRWRHGRHGRRGANHFGRHDYGEWASVCQWHERRIQCGWRCGWQSKPGEHSQPLR